MNGHGNALGADRGPRLNNHHAENNPRIFPAGMEPIKSTGQPWTMLMTSPKHHQRRRQEKSRYLYGEGEDHEER